MSRPRNTWRETRMDGGTGGRAMRIWLSFPRLS